GSGGGGRLPRLGTLELRDGRRLACRRRRPARHPDHERPRQEEDDMKRACIGCSVLVAVGGAAQAAEYPTKVVRLVAPFSPGGSTDVLTRLVAAQLGKRWNEQVVVENRVGA